MGSEMCIRDRIKTASGGSEVILEKQKEALTITGDDGVDKVTGGEGIDTIDGGKGDDIITGGAGVDTFKVDVGTDTITDLGGSSGGESDKLIISKDLLSSCNKDLPNIMNYDKHAQSGSMLNTPPTFAWYMAGKVFKWLKSLGGLEAVKERNYLKASTLYDLSLIHI